MRRTVLMLMLGLILSCPAWAQLEVARLPAASDQTMQWLLRPVASPHPAPSNDGNPNKRPPFQVLMHHADRNDLSQWYKVTQVNGDVQPNSLAAASDSLYMVFGHKRVYRLVRHPAPNDTILTDVVKMHVQLNLPVPGNVLSSIANEQGYHLILEPQMTVERLASEKETPQDTRLLMQMIDGKWTQSPLPEAVWDVKSLQLVSLGQAGKIGYIGQMEGKLVLATKPADQWQIKQLPLELTMHDRLLNFNMQGHMILATYDLHAEQLLVTLHLVVDDQCLEIGSFQIPDTDFENWALLPVGDKVGLIVQGKSQENTAGSVTLRTLDLQGNQTEEPIQITVGDPTDVINQPGRLVVSLALMVAVMIMFSVWRRDPANARVTVPDGYQIASISKRFLSLMIDLAPCGIVTSYFYGISIQQLVDQWPGVAITWEQLIPGIITITLYTTHTTITEIFTAQTLGKKIMGLSVCTMAGQSPDVWQVILRNLLKILDLIAWYVLPALVIVSAYRQRLGDVVARTVVIQPKPRDFEE